LFLLHTQSINQHVRGIKVEFISFFCKYLEPVEESGSLAKFIIALLNAVGTVPYGTVT